MTLNLPEINPYLYLSLLLGALLFGLAFNWLTGYLTRRGYAEGYLWALVGIGVTMTAVFALPIIGLVNMLVLLSFFAATGSPMAIGSWWRNASNRRRDQERE